MALHRDIYWVGKQWAVTGHGIQACNQKQRSQFDIAAAEIWEDGVQEAVRSLEWVNRDDFDKAVATARNHYPEPPRKTPPPAPTASGPAAPPVSPEIHMAAAPEPQPSRLTAPTFDMRFEGVPAKLWPVWRIRTRSYGPPDSP
jgi:hypothetical protein